jgi:glycosyltransferase involved in cell wall biosynthesis
MERIGIVAIGRNEGERLVRAMDSLKGLDAHIVYVDSASTDDSIAVAQAAGADIVRLDMAIPFTAARARNEGAALLLERHPELRLIQFIDGDCEIVPGWIEAATAFLDAHPKAAIVCGRRREKFPEASVFNALCDAEWDTPIGRAEACGGDALMRVEAFVAVGGFDPAMIAHEEPEMSARIREGGWEIWRIDAEMTLHDAAMTRWSQYWKRGRRGGFGFVQVLHKNGFSPGSDTFRPVMSALLWGAILPLAILLAALIWPPALVALPLIYGLQFLGIYVRVKGTPRFRATRALAVLFAKFAETRGILEFAFKRLTNRRMDAILYKGDARRSESG